MNISNKVFWIFCVLIAGLFLSSYLGNMVESFVIASDSSGNGSSTNYITHSQNFDTSTFHGMTDSSGNTSYDNYNHYDGSASNSLITGTVFYGPNGGQATVITGADGKQIIRIVLPNDPTPIVYNYITVNTWQGPNGSATVVKDSNGGMALKISLNSGQTYVFTINPIGTGTGGGNGSSTGGTSTTGTSGNSYSPYTDSTYNSSSGSNAYLPSSSSSTNSGASSYGIPKSMIPSGQEDLYVLKTSIIPPICPAPTVINTCKNDTPPPPCPPCARCPEPSFDCKKVPNYSAVNNQFMPVPVLADFSQFGM